MSRLVARILLSILLFPLAALLYAVAAVVAERLGNLWGFRQASWFAPADVVTWSGVAIYWCLLWRTTVRWTSRRRLLTLVAALGSGLVGVGGGAAALAFLSDDRDFSAFVGGVLAVMLWLVATVFLWRETAVERAGRLGAAGGSTVTCPACGYNLTGLAEARCPECGSRFTLDELIAAQPARVAAADLD